MEFNMNGIRCICTADLIESQFAWLAKDQCWLPKDKRRGRITVCTIIQRLTLDGNYKSCCSIYTLRPMFKVLLGNHKTWCSKWTRNEKLPPRKCSNASVVHNNKYLMNSRVRKMFFVVKLWSLANIDGKNYGCTTADLICKHLQQLIKIIIKL